MVPSLAPPSICLLVLFILARSGSAVEIWTYDNEGCSGKSLKLHIQKTGCTSSEFQSSRVNCTRQPTEDDPEGGDYVVDVMGYARTDCGGNPTEEAIIKHSECVKWTEGGWAIIDCSAGSMNAPNQSLLLLLLTIFVLLTIMNGVDGVAVQTFTTTDCSGTPLTNEDVESGNCISVGGDDVRASAVYNCIPGKKATTEGGEDETLMTYNLFDTASDCTGNQPPGFPLKMTSNVCSEAVKGSGIYNFIDCSDGSQLKLSVLLVAVVLGVVGMIGMWM